MPAYTANPGQGDDWVLLDLWYEGRDQLSLTVTGPGCAPVTAVYGDYADVATPEVIDVALRALDFLERGVAQVEAAEEPAERADQLIADLVGLARPVTGTSPVSSGASAAPAARAPAAAGADLKRLVRVSLDRLDRMVTIGGELLVARTRLGQRLAATGGVFSGWPGDGVALVCAPKRAPVLRRHSAPTKR